MIASNVINKREENVMASSQPTTSISACRAKMRSARNAIASALLVFTVLFLFFSFDNVAPFGDATRTLACMDASIQYKDFLAWLQNVANGEDSILYSFAKGLGGTPIAVFSYYLSSPFNVLFLCVSSEDIPVMFDIVVMLKLMVAGSTASSFLSYRFPNLQSALSIALAVSYALMQYSITQASNIMWLDGVYMLPVMATAASRLVRNGKGIPSLALAAGFSILFNWYSGAINCLFLIVWFFLELFLQHPEASNSSVSRYVFSRGLRFAAAMLLGVGLSLCLFLPTVFSLMEGRAEGGFGGLNFALFNGNPLTIAYGIIIGSESTASSASLYCGSIALLGCMAMPFLKSLSIRHRAALTAFAALLLLSLYWQPLFVVFSLFIPANSYYFRYAYICVFGLIVIAAAYYESARISRATPAVSQLASSYAAVVPVGIVVSAALVALTIARPYSTVVELAATCIAIILTSLALWTAGRPSPHLPRKRLIAEVAFLTMLVVLCVELGFNAHSLVDSYTEDNLSTRAKYVTEQKDQINEITRSDPGSYRITQDGTDDMDEGGTTAQYNEGMGFGYPTIASYTSAPDNDQLALLDALGYRVCGPNMNIVNTSLLAADSLLGIRYALLTDFIPGYVETNGIPRANGKTAYLNPYALPLAFTTDNEIPSDLPPSDGNPFEYQNQLFSLLLGYRIELYHPASFTSSYQNAGVETVVATYRIEEPECDFALYGNLVLENPDDPSLLTVGGKELSYSQWLSPSAFHIPEGKPTVSLEFNDDNTIEDAQFYWLDLEKLAEATGRLKTGSANVELGLASAKITACADEDGEVLLTSIPYDEGWTAYANGEEVAPSVALGSLMEIPLQKGNNEIELNFTPKGLMLGIAASAASAFALIAICFVSRRGKHRAVPVNHRREPLRPLDQTPDQIEMRQVKWLPRQGIPDLPWQGKESGS